MRGVAPNYRDAIAALHARGERLTPQRLLILEVLQEGAGHRTAEAIHKRVRARFPYSNVAMVYRTLVWLKEQGLVAETDLGGGRAEYEYLGGGGTITWSAWRADSGRNSPTSWCSRWRPRCASGTGSHRASTTSPSSGFAGPASTRAACPRSRSNKRAAGQQEAPRRQAAVARATAPRGTPPPHRVTTTWFMGEPQE